MNYLAIVGAALVPMIVGMIWYSPKVFGNTWMQVNGFTPEHSKGMNMPLILGVMVLMSFFMLAPIGMLCIHQLHIGSIVANEEGMKDPNSAVSIMVKNFMDAYGTNFRTFKHGMFHGFLASLMFALPIITINSLFERRGWKYVALHATYWAVCLMLMGGILCQWA